MAERRLRKVSASISEDGTSVEYRTFGPPDASGHQAVVDTTAMHADQIPHDRLNWFALYGISQVVANGYNRPTVGNDPVEVLAVVNAILADIASGEWSPGRQSFAERDPTDLELAMAEVMGRPIEDIMEHVEDDIQRNDDGSPKLDKRGRTMRVFTKRMLDSIADDPAVKPVYARIVAERAKRLTAEAKAGKSGVSKLGGLFAAPVEPTPAPEAVAAQ